MPKARATNRYHGKHRTTKACGKVRYRDMAEANAALQRLSQSEREVKPSRAYDCPDCNGVHLTSKTDFTDPLLGFRGGRRENR